MVILSLTPGNVSGAHVRSDNSSSPTLWQWPVLQAQLPYIARSMQSTAYVRKKQRPPGSWQIFIVGISQALFPFTGDVVEGLVLQFHSYDLNKEAHLDMSHCY